MFWITEVRSWAEDIQLDGLIETVYFLVWFYILCSALPLLFSFIIKEHCVFEVIGLTSSQQNAKMSESFFQMEDIIE